MTQARDQPSGQEQNGKCDKEIDPGQDPKTPRLQFPAALGGALRIHTGNGYAGFSRRVPAGMILFNFNVVPPGALKTRGKAWAVKGRGGCRGETQDD